MWIRASHQGGRLFHSVYCGGGQIILLFKKIVFCVQADMLDQEAAFMQIQEAKTMVEQDLQRRLEEFEDEKEQLQKMAALAVSLEQQLEQASTHCGLM